MITEDYVSFETAKLLKEKGFDGQCLSKYNFNGFIWDNIRYDGMLLGNNDIFPQEYLAPTLQMAMKWLREKYYIHAAPIKQGNYNDCSEYYTWIVARMGIIHRNSTVADKLSYEEACEAAIKYCLENLI